MPIPVTTRSAVALAILSSGLLATRGDLLADSRRDATVLLGADGHELKPDALPIFRLSTDGEAEDGNILDQEWDLTRAEGGIAPILSNHRLGVEAPMGLGLWRSPRVVTVDGARELHAEADFDLGDEAGARVAGKVRRGYIRSVSVGWRPGFRTLRGDLPKDHRWYRAPMTDDCGTRIEGFVMGRADEPNRLIEASMTPIPSDPGAVQVDGGRAIRAVADLEALATGGRMTGDVGALLLAIRDRPGVRTWAHGLAREALLEMIRTGEARELIDAIGRSAVPLPLSVEDLFQ